MVSFSLQGSAKQSSLSGAGGPESTEGQRQDGQQQRRRQRQRRRAQLRRIHQETPSQQGLRHLTHHLWTQRRRLLCNLNPAQLSRHQTLSRKIPLVLERVKVKLSKICYCDARRCFISPYMYHKQHAGGSAKHVWNKKKLNQALAVQVGDSLSSYRPLQNFGTIQQTSVWHSTDPQNILSNMTALLNLIANFLRVCLKTKLFLLFTVILKAFYSIFMHMQTKGQYSRSWKFSCF